MGTWRKISNAHINTCAQVNLFFMCQNRADLKQYFHGNIPHKDVFLIEERLCLLSTTHFPNYLLSSWGYDQQGREVFFWTRLGLQSTNSSSISVWFPLPKCHRASVMKCSRIVKQKIYIKNNPKCFFCLQGKHSPGKLIIKEYREYKMVKTDLFVWRKMKTRERGSLM